MRRNVPTLCNIVFWQVSAYYLPLSKLTFHKVHVMCFYTKDKVADKSLNLLP